MILCLCSVSEAIRTHQLFQVCEKDALPQWAGWSQELQPDRIREQRLDQSEGPSRDGRQGLRQALQGGPAYSIACLGPHALSFYAPLRKRSGGGGYQAAEQSDREVEQQVLLMVSAHDMEGKQVMKA